MASHFNCATRMRQNVSHHQIRNVGRRHEKESLGKKHWYWAEYDGKSVSAVDRDLRVECGR